MTGRARLSPEALQALAREVSGWRVAEDGRSIHRAFRFRGFPEAWAFLSQVALLAERMDHHPGWSNTYNRVEVTLTTHSAGGLTALDRAFAEAIDRLAPPG